MVICNIDLCIWRLNITVKNGQLVICFVGVGCSTTGLLPQLAYDIHTVRPTIMRHNWWTCIQSKALIWSYERGAPSQLLGLLGIWSWCIMDKLYSALVWDDGVTVLQDCCQTWPMHPQGLLKAWDKMDGPASTPTHHFPCEWGTSSKLGLKIRCLAEY